MIQFEAKTRIIIPYNFKNDILSLLQEEKSQKAVIIIDKNIADSEIIRELIKYIESKIRLSVYIVKSKEPTTGMVNEYTKYIRTENVDVLIGIGGGSIIDLTKALSVMAVNEGRVEDYHGTGKPFTAGLKKIMIPTTSGTGSEVTPGAVLINASTRFKRAISGKYVTPDYAVLYPELTLSMPDSVLASTGMDALAHAIESYVAKSSNIITKMYSKQAFYLIYNNLNKVFNDRQNIKLRKNLLLGSCLAGFAIFNSNTGACHSMAYPLGIYNGIPHSIAVAHLLPKVVKLNVEKGCFVYADLYALIEGSEQGGTPKQKSELFSSLLEEYLPLAYINKKFSHYGVNKSNYEFLAERGLDLTPALINNPVEFGLSDAKIVLKQLFDPK